MNVHVQIFVNWILHGVKIIKFVKTYFKLFLFYCFSLIVSLFTGTIFAGGLLYSITCNSQRFTPNSTEKNQVTLWVGNHCYCCKYTLI